MECPWTEFQLGIAQDCRRDKRSGPGHSWSAETEGKADWVASQTGLTKVPGDAHGVALFYRASKYRVLDNGIFNLVERDQYGQRIVLWAKYQDKASGTEFYHFNQHWCLCSESQGVNNAKVVAENMHRIAGPANAVFTGDLNTFAMTTPPYPNGIRYLMGNYGNSPVQLRDVLGEMGATHGTFGATRVDWMLAQGNVNFVDAAVQQGTTGSDHSYIEATITFH